MKSQSIISPENQKVSFVELFFDLMFVFSVTQVVSFFHHEPDWTAVGQAVLVFWLIWWAWTQFTWSLNAADTTHHTVVLAVEEVVAHPSEALSLIGRGSLAVALLLFVEGTAVAVWRAKGQWLLPRIILIGVTAVVIVGITAVSALYTLLIALVGVVLIVVLEQRQ